MNLTLEISVKVDFLKRVLGGKETVILCSLLSRDLRFVMRGLGLRDLQDTSSTKSKDIDTDIVID